MQLRVLDPSAPFSPFDIGHVTKIRRHCCKEHLKISKTAKCESLVFYDHEVISWQRQKVLQTFVCWVGGNITWPSPPPRLQTSVKFPNFVAYFLYFSRCHYQSWSNYELLGALSSSIHRFSLLRQNPKLEKKPCKGPLFPIVPVI